MVGNRFVEVNQEPNESADMVLGEAARRTEVDVGFAHVPVPGHNVEVFLDGILYHANPLLPGTPQIGNSVPKIAKKYRGYDFDAVGEGMIHVFDCRVCCD